MAEIVTIKIGPHRDLGFEEEDVHGTLRHVVGWEDGWDPMDESVRGEVWDRCLSSNKSACRHQLI